MDRQPVLFEDIKAGKTNISHKIVYRDLSRSNGYKRGVELTKSETGRGNSIAARKDLQFYVVQPNESVIFHGKDYNSVYPNTHRLSYFPNSYTGKESIQLVVARNVSKPTGNQSEAVWPRFRSWLDAVNLAVVSNRCNICVCFIPLQIHAQIKSTLPFSHTTIAK